MALTARITGKDGEKKLQVTIDLEEEIRPSASGKTMVVATSHGNQATTVIVDGKPLTIGLNAYIKK